MTLPPSTGYGSCASLHQHRRTHCTPSRSTSNGRTRPRARSGRRPVAVFSHQEGREHFDRPLVEGPVVDHHLHGGTGEPPDPLSRRGGADDDVHAPHEATEGSPLGGTDPDEGDVRQAGVGDRVLQVVGRLDRGGGHAHPRPRRELGQAVERLEMRLGEQRDHRNSLALQELLHLREMTKARDRNPPATGLLLPPCDRRELGEEHLVDADRQVGLELPGKKVELRRTALHQEDLDGPANGGGPDPGQAQNAHRQVVGGHPEGRGPDHRILQEALAEMRGGAGGRGGGGGAGATNTPFPRRASTYPLCFRSSITRATVFGLTPRKPASSRMLGNAWSLGTPPASMTWRSCSVSCRRIGIGLWPSILRFIAILILYGYSSTLGQFNQGVLF